MFIRFDPEVLRRLRQTAQTTRGATASSLAQRLIDEGLRMAEFPGVVFTDGPRGRRATLIGGQDVWEVVVAVRDVRAADRDAIDAASEVLGIPYSMVKTAMEYYSAYRGEIHTEIDRASRHRPAEAKTAQAS